MSRRNLKAALQESGGAKAYVSSDMHDDMTDEELRTAAFESRRNQDADINMKMANDNRRNTLLRKAGFDWFDVDDLHPHPDNSYSIDQESIENLAGLIYTSKEVQPLVIRETKEGLQILDGERRWRACKLLAERYGDAWRMVPAHCHPIDSITDEQSLFILHSNNLGQRNLTPSERAMGFKVIADALVEWRKNDKSLKGIKTKTYLAQHFGVSERTAVSTLNIAKGLIQEGMNLLDEGGLTKEQAEQLSRLEEKQQQAIIESVRDKDWNSEEISALIDAARTSGEPIANLTHKIQAKGPKRKKGTNEYLKTARNALKHAYRNPGEANWALLGEIKQLVKEIDQQQNEISQWKADA